MDKDLSDDWGRPPRVPVVTYGEDPAAGLCSRHAVSGAPDAAPVRPTTPTPAAFLNAMTVNEPRNPATPGLDWTVASLSVPGGLRSKSRMRRPALLVF